MLQPSAPLAQARTTRNVGTVTFFVGKCAACLAGNFTWRGMGHASASDDM